MNKRIKATLLLGCIVVAAGLIVCIAGAIVSNVNSEKLFAEKMENGKGYTYPLNEEKLTGIDITVTDATVNIIGDSTEGKIEVINFDENLYYMDNDAAKLSFKESSGYKQVLNFFESGFTFKGVRHIVRLDPPSGEKIINIYLSDKNILKNCYITTGKGKIAVENMGSNVTYRFSVQDGSVAMNNVTTESDITLSALQSSDLSIVFNSVKAKNLSIESADAELKSSALSFEGGKISITHGSAQVDYIPASQYFKLGVNANGKLTVNESPYTSTYSFEKLPEPSDDPDAEETTAAVPTITIDGRELSVYLTGECFGEAETSEGTEK